MAMFEGDAAGGEPAEAAVFVPGGWNRASIDAKTGTVSRESGERPSGKVGRLVGGWGVEWAGEVVIIS